jgi:hypothetical protein
MTNWTQSVARLALVLCIAIPVLAQYGRRSSVGRRSSDPPPVGQTPVATFAGTVRGIDAKILTIEGPESNTLLFHCSKKTKYYDGEKEIKRDLIKAGDQVSVDGRRAPDATLDAVIVHIEHPKPTPEDKPSD